MLFGKRKTRELYVTDLEYLLRLHAALDTTYSRIFHDLLSSSKPLRLRSLRECKERLRKNFGRRLA